ncbi:type III pantothenate kinase [Microbulbifer sp.]|uniref:type III pantothenate kinase n=1 Tax=Microbulbifer sp. TaxID=1908541 RepID=UPI0025829C99|nr:type III pantothenate kinase [Microbulbifer sp.]
MSILELDLGNTRCKWRQLASAGVADVVSRGAFATSAWRSGALPGDWQGLSLSRVRVANVAGEGVAEAVRQYFMDGFGLEPEFAKVSTRCAGVTCAYKDVSRLGVDRWLAVLAAHQRDPSPSLVVDCGSAVTLDLLGSGGCHLGGYIVPGLALMRRALFQDTDAVKVHGGTAASRSLAPGRDTAEAVNRGLPLMVLGAIEEARQQLMSAAVGPSEPAPKVWITGGDSAYLSSLCTLEHVRVDDLVLEGLALTNP